LLDVLLLSERWIAARSANARNDEHYLERLVQRFEMFLVLRDALLRSAPQDEGWCSKPNDGLPRALRALTMTNEG